MNLLRRAILFDLDGTLVDSLPDIIASFQHAFGTLGLTPPSDEAVRACIGLPLEQMYVRFAPAMVLPLCAAYREHYRMHCAVRSRPFQGVSQALRVLRERGYRLAVATTKRTDLAERLLGAVGLRDAVDHVQGTEGFPHKPAPDVILRALAALGAEGTWMVGDTQLDIHAGRAAGLRTYAVTWGTERAETLAAARPDELQPDLGRLLEHLPPLVVQRPSRA